VRRPHPLDVWAHCARLFVDERLHRLVPDGLALALARTVGRARWLWPPARRRALGRISLTIAGTRRESEAASLAREELVVRTIHNTFMWRPWAVANVPLISRDTLDAALSSGRPVILASVHLSADCITVLAEHGYRDFTAVTGRWLLPTAEELPPGGVGHMVLAFRRRAEAAGLRLVAAGGTYPQLRALLDEGVRLVLMADLPGTTTTRMAGKTAYLRSGVARLACETDALVVPIAAVLEGDGARVTVLEPLDAREADGPQQLLDRLAEIFGEVMLEHPASIEPLGFAREIWRDYSASYPIELWRPPRARDRAVALRRRVLRLAAAAR
jgi:lauroyl/myristoyl acyltransferase